jgi:GNAT superfamily N-acetyltransferase
MHVLVAVDSKDRVVGTLSWVRTSVESGHFRGMAVVPELQGAGVAQLLLDWALDEMRQAGCRLATLRTTEPLDRAIRFYERNHFRPSGKTADFHGMTVTERARRLDAAGP